jgi:hypothetical protein
LLNFYVKNIDYWWWFMNNLIMDYYEWLWYLKCWGPHWCVTTLEVWCYWEMNFYGGIRLKSISHNGIGRIELQHVYSRCNDMVSVWKLDVMILTANIVFGLFMLWSCFIIWVKWYKPYGYRNPKTHSQIDYFQ